MWFCIVEVDSSFGRVWLRADQTNASLIHHIIHSKLRELRSMNGVPQPVGLVIFWSSHQLLGLMLVRFDTTVVNIDYLGIWLGRMLTHLW